MIKMYKDGNECSVDNAQIKAMSGAGWSMTEAAVEAKEEVVIPTTPAPVVIPPVAPVVAPVIPPVAARRPPVVK